MKLKNFFLLVSAFALLLLLPATGCKKNLPEQASTSPNNSENEKPDLDFPHLFFSYESTPVENGGNLAVTDVFNGNTNFNLSTFANPRPIFYSYVKSTNEIWGIRNVTVNSKKKLLTKFSLADKTYTDVDIFPFSNSSRQIIKVDETNKYIYFLEGTSGYKGFNKVMRCNFNGGDMKVMYEDNKNDIASAMMGIGNKIYYHSVTYAALMELDLATKKSKVMVINFYPTSGLKFTGFKEIVKNNIAYWQPQYTTKYISARALNSYDIDFSTNTVFWLENPTGLIKKTPGEDASAKYNKLTPVLMAAGLNGVNNNTTYGSDFSTILPLPKDRYSAKMVINASLKINRSTKKLYLALEEVESSGAMPGTFNGDFENEVSQFRRFKIVQTDYKGKQPVSLLTSQNKYYNYPLYWQTYPQNPPVKWESTLSAIFYGSFNSFIFTNLNEPMK